MTPERTALLATVFVLTLGAGCTRSDHSGTTDAQAGESPEIGLEARLTDHMAAAATWGDLVQTLATSDTRIGPLAASAAHMEEEISQALDLAEDPESEALRGDAGQIDPAGHLRIEKLEEARARATEVGRLLASANPDRQALADASGEASAAVQAAGQAHDSIIPALSDRQHPFRMFALTWPHHELALRYALLDQEVSRMESAQDSNWTATWKVRIDHLEDEVLDCRSAFRAFAGKLDPLANTYGRERRDDRFNAWTDGMRQQHDAIQGLIGDIRAELARTAPDRTKALAALESLRSDLDAARENHRKVAQEIGEPYPDYQTAIERVMNEGTGQTSS